jgi:thiosulfate reductase cytochrome b subunit
MVLYTIDPRAYERSEHGRLDCVACHDSGYADSLPHHGPPSRARFLCVGCHEALGDLEQLDLPARRDELQRGAHGDEDQRRMDCHDCHDPHRFRLVRSHPSPFQRIERSNAICLRCHGEPLTRASGYGALNDAAETHDRFPNVARHFTRVKCVLCHTAAKTGAGHDIANAAASLGSCEECHRRADPTYAANYGDTPAESGPREGVYVVGSSRSVWLDRGSQVGFLALVLLILAHVLRRRQSTGRWVFSEATHFRGPKPIRLWHGLQSALLLGLLCTGLSMHYSDSGWAPFSFRAAVRTHNALGVANALLWIAFLVSNARSGNVRSYLGRLGSALFEIGPQARYYLLGTFRGEREPGPSHPSERFNPLQKLAYVALMYVISPVLVFSGSLLLFPALAPERALGQPGIWPMAMIHLSAAYAISLFVVIHLYMVVSGGPPSSREGADAPKGSPPASRAPSDA